MQRVNRNWMLIPLVNFGVLDFHGYENNTVMGNVLNSGNRDWMICGEIELRRRSSAKMRREVRKHNLFFYMMSGV